MTCLDTSFLVDLLRGERAAVGTASDFDEDGERATVTPVSAADVWVGAQLGTHAERDATSELLESLTWLDFSRNSARLAGEIQADLKREGNPIGFADCMIAAIATENGESLLTRDSDFERIDGLNVRTY